MAIKEKIAVSPETKAERKLVFKIDWFILSFCCLMYWVNYLDRANLNNAYVSGMKEDLKMFGKEFNIINTVFYGGYLFGQIPNNLALQYFPPRIYFPCAMIVWGLFTLGTAFVHSATQIMVIRFFQATAEASTFVGVQYVLGAWYKRAELGKRTAIFTSSGLAGTMFSGFIQGGIYSNLNGHGGLAGWRWMFIIDFLITLPIALYGFFVFPDLPANTRAPYLTAAEKALAVSRLPPVTHERGHINLAFLRRTLCSWHIYGFTLLWLFASNTEMFSTNAVLQIYLKSTKQYSVSQVNYIPTGISAVGIVTTLTLGLYSDITRCRWHVGLFLAATAITTGALILQPPSYNAKLFAFFLNGCQYAGQTVFFAWANDRLYRDDAKRSVVIACMNTFSIAVYMFWSLLFYNATQGPEWRDGNIAMVVMGFMTGVTTVGVRLMEGWEEKRGRRWSVADTMKGEDEEVGAEKVEKREEAALGKQ